MKLVADKQAVSMLIGTLIAVIITVIFVVAVGNFVGGIVSNIPTVRGEIGEPTEVVCFGIDNNEATYCISKKDGSEKFYFEAAKKWRDPSEIKAEYYRLAHTPVLTPNGDIFFSAANHFCAYTSVGENKWPVGCKGFDHKIPAGATVDEKYVCFGDGGSSDDKGDEKIRCLERETGQEVFTFPYPGERRYTEVNKEVVIDGPVISTPVLEGNTIYYAIAKVVRKQKLGNPRSDWEIRRVGGWITSDLAVGEKDICFSSMYRGGKIGRVYCHDKDEGRSTYASEEGGTALSTPAIDGDYVYLALGNLFKKWHLRAGALDKQIQVQNVIPTGIALGDGLACFGEGNTVHCLDAGDLTERFSVTAPDGWAEKLAFSTPLILDKVVYFGLGDKVCAYDTAAEGVKMPADAKWCVDFDYMITTGIAGLPAEEES